MMLFKLCLSLIILLQTAQAFIMDATTWVSRDGKLTTPALEAVQRGASEPFAQYVGQVRIKLDGSRESLSSGTLIAPNIVLTAAHCVDEVSVTRPGSFILTVNGSQFTRKISAVELQPSYLLGMISGRKLNFQENDIAVVKLDIPIEVGSCPQLYQGRVDELIAQSIDSGRPPKFIGVSAEFLTQNGKPHETYQGRHIGIFQMRKSVERRRLIASSWIPVNYNPTSIKESIDGKAYVPEFSYDYSRDKVFLHATLRGGDSGGPLFASLRGKYQLVGVAGGQIYHDAYNKDTRMFVPGKSYFDCWTAVHDYAEWIQESIVKLQKM